MDDPTRIKNSMWFTRGKNDAIDAARIAEYAYHYSDKVCLKKVIYKSVKSIVKTPVSNSSVATDEFRLRPVAVIYFSFNSFSISSIDGRLCL